MNKRPGNNGNYLKIATVLAERATCVRRKYGAVIMKYGSIVGTGYCGAHRGAVECISHSCNSKHLR